MKDKSRRDFLKWVGVAPAGTLLLWELGCGGSRSGLTDAGRDVGTAKDVARGDAASSRMDGGTNAADAAAMKDATAADADAGAGEDMSAVDAEVDAESPDATEAECEATGSDVEGPFHLDGAPNRTTLAAADEPGQRIVVEGRVLAPDCMTPVSEALLDVWHADDNGDYDDSTVEYRLRGQMQTGSDGRYRFESIKPGRYPLGGSTRPAHIHFIISKPGFAPLTTQMYFAGDPFLGSNDPCGDGCNSNDPTLIIDFEEVDGVLYGTFDIVLQRS